MVCPVLKSVVSDAVIGHCKTEGIDVRSNEKKPFRCLAKSSVSSVLTSLVANATVASIIPGKRSVTFQLPYSGVFPVAV